MKDYVCREVRTKGIVCAGTDMELQVGEMAVFVIENGKTTVAYSLDYASGQPMIMDALEESLNDMDDE